MCVVSCGLQPGLSSRFQVSLEIWILLQILVERIASEKWVTANTELICSSQPAKCFAILMGSGQNFCDVYTIPGVGPVHTLILAEPCRYRNGLAS